MLLKHRTPLTLKDNDVTPHRVYLNRRNLVLGGIATTALAACGEASSDDAPSATQAAPKGALEYTKSAYTTSETQTPFEQATTYNNYYEFGTSKTDPAARAGQLVTEPWSIKVSGLVGKPGVYDLETLMKQQLEERIYRLRCVEAWSMVIPWIGFPMSALIDMVEPLGSAKYVGFKTLYRPEQMPGLRYPILDWPYEEGLRLDEARNPLTLMAVGVYGRLLPNQNGAPIRLVVPWKYGFKSIKSIVEIAFSDEQPATSWNKSAPQEYGFYSNVNPAVSHPRWSQATERRLDGRGGLAMLTRQETLPFNGYADEVASLYDGMDLAKFY